MAAGPRFLVRLCAWVTVAQSRRQRTLGAQVVLDLRTWCDFNDFQSVDTRCWVLFALHNQHVFEALVICATVSVGPLPMPSNSKSSRASTTAHGLNEPARVTASA